MPTTHYGLCNFCDSVCGLEIETEGTRIVAIRGDKRNSFSRGHVCPKGIAQQDLHHDPDRLKRPLRKKGDGWEEVSWDEALDEAGAALAEVQRRHGPNALAVYWGNPASHDYGALLNVLLFTRGFKTKNVFSANSVDALARMLVSLLMYGNQAVLPIPDLERTDHLLIIGANPVVSNGSIMTAPDCRKRLLELRERGGKIVVIDPRRTETARIADRHHFIRPGTDPLFLFAVLNVLFERDLIAPGALAARLEGLDRLKAKAALFPPARVEKATGVPAAEIERIAVEFGQAKSAVCYTRMGTSTVEFGALATGLVDVLNIVTGNLGRPGGAMFCSPAVDLLWVSRLTRQPGDFNRWQSRVSGLPEFNGEFPVAALAEEMETPGMGQVKALVTLAGNPILSLPNGRRLDRAFAGLEYMVSIDYYVNETTRHANIILPPVSPLSSDHYPILELAMGIRDFTHYAPAVFPKPEGAKHNWEIMTDLVYSLDRHRGPVAAAAGRVKRKLLYWLHPYRQLKLLLRLGPRKLSIETLLAAVHGLDLGPLSPGADKVICRKNGRIDLLPPELEADVDRLQKKLEAGPSLAEDELILVSRRTTRSINSWMHNSHRLVKGKDQCTLMVHPDDAARLSLAAGGTAVVSSRVGEVRVPLEVTDEMMPGVASMAFGWGHDRPGARLTIAGQHPGASMNDILDETLFDRVSGISVLDGVLVKVRPGG